MKKQDLQKLLSQYNGLYKEMDEVYHTLARHYGLSDCALWILYILRETQTPQTQNEICELLSLSKQTVNSALKKLEKEDYIRLEPQPGSQKNKLVRFTARGEALAEKTIDNVFEMEQAAFAQFSDDECAVYLQLIQKHVRCLQREAENIITTQM